MRGYSCIGLYSPQNNLNIGAVLRAAGVYSASMVAISQSRYQVASSDTMCHYRHLPLLQVENLRDVIPYDCVPVAVDLLDEATPLPEYKHPQRAFYVFGPENGTLGKKVTEWCRDIVYVPTQGCMNLAATVNVVLYDRLAKAVLT